MELLIVAVLGLLGIAAATAIGPKLGFSAPLLLVMVGILVSLLPFVPDIEIEPEWILAGVLPPLLYSASVSMPSMEFRREFGAISGLSIALVVVSSVALGLLFTWIVPGVSLAAGIALGAIVSPTDAVATSIVKRVGVSPRIVTVLEGESLLNDATALVLLRSAIAATAATIASGRSSATSSSRSRWPSSSDTWSARRTSGCGRGSTEPRSTRSSRSRCRSSPPSERSARGIRPRRRRRGRAGHRARRDPQPLAAAPRSDVQNSHAIELILEGTVFLVMGLELSTLLDDLTNETRGIELGARVAGITLLAVLVVRALFVFPMLGLQRTAPVAAQMKPRLTAFQERLDGGPARPSRPNARAGRGRADPDARTRPSRSAASRPASGARSPTSTTS